MIVVIVTVCAAFGLTVSEAKTEIMYLHTRGRPAASTLNVAVASGIPLVRKHMISVLASETIDR